MKKLFILLFIAAAFSVTGFMQTYHYDVNGDGSITSYDITSLYNYLLNNDMTYFSNSDVNGDGAVTAADVTALYDWMLGNVSVEPTHEYVELGLPSGTLWATMNVGANSPGEYGDLFAWGEITAKNYYDWSTYKWCNGSYNTMTKYCNDSSYGYNGFVDDKTELDPEDDAATANWGPGWRIPSSEQIRELYNNCTSQWITTNGVIGCLFISKINGASLFIPAAGYRYGNNLISRGTYGRYWSRTLRTTATYRSSYLFFDSSSVRLGVDDRKIGFSVRPVWAVQK